MAVFVCDEMLAGLGKWLRAAGYDAEIAVSGTCDRDLLEQAIAEGRILLTRDRKLVEYKDAGNVVFLLTGNEPDGWAEALVRDLDVDWLYHPFSRCLLCNRILKPGPGPYAQQLPLHVVEKQLPCFHCPHCHKAFWLGGHAERMRRRLTRWSRISKG